MIPSVLLGILMNLDFLFSLSLLTGESILEIHKLDHYIKKILVLYSSPSCMLSSGPLINLTRIFFILWILMELFVAVVEMVVEKPPSIDSHCRNLF